jgi:hypothetical protein
MMLTSATHSKPTGARDLSSPDGLPPRSAALPTDQPTGAIEGKSPGTIAPRLADPFLSLAAETVDDLEKVRTACENRLRILIGTVDDDGNPLPDKDGIVRAHGLAGHPDVERLAGLTAALKDLEHSAVLDLQRRMRRHPLGAWVKSQRGIGEKQAARLLAAVGDPYWHTLNDAPRTVSQLWAYCGLHTLPVGHENGDTQREDADGAHSSDPGHIRSDVQLSPARVAARRRKGVRSNWSSTAKMRAYLCAESCLKQLVKPCAVPDGQKWAAHVAGECRCSPFRVIYDARRAHTSSTHPEWADGHSHNDALRIMSKAILKDLWRAARDLHLGWP